MFAEKLFVSLEKFFAIFLFTPSTSVVYFIFSMRTELWDGSVNGTIRPPTAGDQ